MKENAVDFTLRLKKMGYTAFVEIPTYDRIVIHGSENLNSGTIKLLEKEAGSFDLSIKDWLITNKTLFLWLEDLECN